MNEPMQHQPLPELSLEDYGTSGEDIAHDLFMELYEADSPADVISRFAGYLAEDVNGEHYVPNKEMLGGFIRGMLEWIPNLKQK